MYELRLFGRLFRCIFVFLSHCRDLAGGVVWKAQFKAAEAAQAADLAKVNADISPPVATGGVLFSMTGSGIETTEPFTVPSSANGWHVAWTYNCASFGFSGCVAQWWGALQPFPRPAGSWRRPSYEPLGTE
jgi:hypothetical protein